MRNAKWMIWQFIHVSKFKWFFWRLRNVDHTISVASLIENGQPLSMWLIKQKWICGGSTEYKWLVDLQDTGGPLNFYPCPHEYSASMAKDFPNTAFNQGRRFQDLHCPTSVLRRKCLINPVLNEICNQTCSQSHPLHADPLACPSSKNHLLIGDKVPKTKCRGDTAKGRFTILWDKEYVWTQFHYSRSLKDQNTYIYSSLYIFPQRPPPTTTS